MILPIMSDNVRFPTNPDTDCKHMEQPPGDQRLSMLAVAHNNSVFLFLFLTLASTAIVLEKPRLS